MLCFRLVWCPEYRRRGPGGEIASALADLLGERFPWLRRRLPSLWSRAHFAGSAGHVSAATVRRYFAVHQGR
jgi:putative transposase